MSRTPNVRRLATVVLSRGLGDWKILSLQRDSLILSLVGMRGNPWMSSEVCKHGGEEARGHESSLPLSSSPDLNIIVSDREQEAMSKPVTSLLALNSKSRNKSLANGQSATQI